MYSPGLQMEKEQEGSAEVQLVKNITLKREKYDLVHVLYVP